MKRIYTLILMVVILALACGVSACNKTEEPSQPHTYTYAFSAEGLDNNPDRGFRGELYLTLGRYGTWPGDAMVSSPTAALDAELAAYPEKINVIQQYVYLIDFFDKDLSTEALSQLTTYLEYVRSKDVKLLLRFAYEYDESVGKGPTTSQILRHIETLKGWLNDGEHLDLFKDVIYSVQLGMIGLWGEGHTSVYSHDEQAIMEAMAGFIPEPYTIMLRYYNFYAKIPETLKGRFGINEDWLVGEKKHLWDFFKMFAYQNRKSVLAESRYTINDVEMPWGRDKTCGEVEPLNLITEIRDYSATTMSIKHNYIEDGIPSEYNLARYKQLYLTEQELIDNTLPYRKELLSDGRICAFDYIMYHLGYLLTVDSMTVTGKTHTFTLSNYGFAAPVYYKLQVLASDGTILTEQPLKDLISGASTTVTVETASSGIGVRIVHTAAPDYTVKLANDVSYEDGLNLLSEK